MPVIGLLSGGRAGLQRRPLGQAIVAAPAGALVGAGVAFDRHLAMALLTVAAVLVLQSLGWRRLVPLLIGLTFVTRFRAQLFGLHFLPEHLLALACLLALLAREGGGRLYRAVTDRAVVLFGGFIAWNAVVSVVRSPQPVESLAIVGWLGLDWVMLVVLVAATDQARTIAHYGVRWLGVAAAAAVVLWVTAVSGLTSFGVQYEHTFEANSAYGLSFESNILAATLAVWVFLALTWRHILPPAARRMVVPLALFAIALSFTRAAAAGLAAGLLVWAVLRGGGGWRTVARVSAMSIAGALLFLAIAPGLARPIAAKTGMLLDFASGNGRVRVTAWTTAVGDLHGPDWLVGLGSNSFGQRHLDPTLPDTPTPAYLGNLPLQVVYDSGLVGAALLVAALVAVLPRERRRGAVALGLITVYLACAVATSPFWFGTTWALMAMAVLNRRQEVEEEATPPGLVPPLVVPQPLPR